MKKLRILIAIFLLGGALTTVSAQNKCGLSIHLGGILPMGQFTECPTYVSPGDANNQLSAHGAALFGASLGLRYNYKFIGTHIEDSGFGIFVSADLMWNYVKKSVRDTYDAAKCTKPMYVNVPIMIGASWTSDFVRSPVNIFGEVGIGCDLFKKTTEGWSGKTISYDMNPEFACEAGVGVIFARLFSIGIHYYWLGKQDIKVTGTTYGEGFAAAPTMAMHAMAFKLGFHF